MHNSMASRHNRILRQLGELKEQSTDDVDSLLFACAMALAHRLEYSPRTILDMAFMCAVEDEQWASAHPSLVEFGVI